MVERGITGAANANNSSAKTVTEANGNFDIEKMSIAFNVNDNFSVSWGELTETYDEQGGGGAGSTAVADVDMSSTSIQFSYTCLLYTSPSPRDQRGSRMPSSA